MPKPLCNTCPQPGNCRAYLQCLGRREVEPRSYRGADVLDFVIGSSVAMLALGWLVRGWLT